MPAKARRRLNIASKAAYQRRYNSSPAGRRTDRNALPMMTPGERKRLPLHQSGWFMIENVKDEEGEFQALEQYLWENVYLATGSAAAGRR